MKRNMDLFRKIMLEIENQYKVGQTLMNGLPIEGHDKMEVGEYCQLLKDNYFIQEYNPTIGGGYLVFFKVGNLTSQGFDFLERIRDEQVWEKTKKFILDKNLDMTPTTIFHIANAINIKKVETALKDISEE